MVQVEKLRNLGLEEGLDKINASRISRHSELHCRRLEASGMSWGPPDSIGRSSSRTLSDRCKETYQLVSRNPPPLGWSVRMCPPLNLNGFVILRDCCLPSLRFGKEKPRSTRVHSNRTGKTFQECSSHEVSWSYRWNSLFFGRSNGTWCWKW